MKSFDNPHGHRRPIAPMLAINNQNSRTMTSKEFNEKWDGRYRPGMELSETREYLSDCFDMFETEGFCETFESPYGNMKEHNGKTFKVVRRCSEKDWDIECLPAWVILFQDGIQIDALPEEICKIERNIQ